MNQKQFMSTLEFSQSVKSVIVTLFNLYMYYHTNDSSLSGADRCEVQGYQK